MLTLQDLRLDIMKIREAVGELTVKGPNNASLIVYVDRKCNDLIQAINEAAQKLANPSDSQNGIDDAPAGDGEIDGESNSGTAT